MVLVFALALACLIAPFASRWPDGLERVALDKGFLEKADGSAPVIFPIPDYEWPGIRHKGLSCAMAGALGTFLVFFSALGFARVLKKKKRAAPLS